MTDYYVGIDVHKTELQAAVLSDESQVENSPTRNRKLWI